MHQESSAPALADMDRPVLALDSVTKRFGPIVAADAITLEVGAEFFSLLGPSGSGKTTMLRIIAGLEKPDSGRVLIAGQEVTRLPPYRRRLGMVFQDFLLFPHKTVVENIVFPLRMQGASSAEKSENVRWVMDLVRLSGLEERYPHQLSGGQKQRVALARGLVSRPTLLLLDEPLANLDRELRKEMEVEVRRFQIELGIPFVYVTHNQEEALIMSDRMAVMRSGRLEQVGRKLDLYHHPRTPFVASFLGETNALRGRVTGIADGLAAVEVAGLPLLGKAHDGLSAGAPATLFVKSERIELVLPGTAGALAGNLRDVIFKGAYVSYLVEVSGHGEVVVSGAPNRALPGQGAPTALRWDPQSADVFAAE